MKRKRLGALLLALALMLGVSAPVLPAVGLATAAGAIPARDAGDQYFGSQLAAGSAERAFYDAMVAMYKDGDLLTGADKEVALPADAMDLGSAVSTARDAFYMDYPDLFYVNFNNFAVKQAGGRTYIAPGTRGTGYLLDGIEPGAVPGLTANYDAKLAELVQTAAGSSQRADAVRAVHDKLAGMLTYKLDNECAAENQKFIRTAYGIVTGEGVCEAYSRAFKSAMDELNIPCVLVEGAFRHSAEHIEAHMWACVEVDGQWYGVDVTMDDPDKEIKDATGAVRAAYDDYLLAGDVTMSAQHAASATMSAANYEFAYPTLTQNDHGVVTMHDAGGLVVRLDPDDDRFYYEGDEGAGTFYVSYNGMSYSEAAKNGYYILAHFMSVDKDASVGHEHFEGTYEWSTNKDWSYLCTDLYPAIESLETATETPLPLPHVRYVQFAVTDVPPGKYTDATNADDVYNATHYQGDPALLLAKTEVFENPDGTYIAPPYIKQAWPTQQSTMLIGQTYKIEARMDDRLIPDPANPEAGLGCDIKAYAFIGGEREDYWGEDEYSAANYCTAENFALKDNSDGTSSITFTFRPSDQWAHDTIFYEFDFTGVVGEKSGKKPNSLVYLASHPCSAYAYQSEGFDWNLYAKPQLLDDPLDVNTDGWEDKNGQTVQVPLELKHRMTLVVTDTTKDQTREMNKLAADNAGSQELLATETYSINLTVCKSQIVKTGQAVRVMLGFPKGYGPESAGVTFKAYHYGVDKYGNIDPTDVKEIPCIVTEYGLLVLCDSFSPFSVSVLNGGEQTGPGAGTDPDTGTTSRNVVVMTNGGGTVTINGSAENVYTVQQGQRYEVMVTAPDGKQISSITVGGESIEVTDRGMMKFTLSYEQLQGILDVQFATAEWIENEKTDPQTLPEVTVTVPEKFDKKTGEELKIPATVTVKEPDAATAETAGSANGYACTYQWFKDGEKLELPEQTAELVISAAEAKNAGVYMVQAAVKKEGTEVSRVAVSKPGCTVTVASSAPAPSAEPTAAPTQAPSSGGNGSSNNNNNSNNTSSGQQASSTPAPTPVPTPAPTPVPAAPAAPAPVATAKPAGSNGNSGSKTGSTVTAAATPTATPAPATPAPALTNTPAPTAPPAAEPAPEATVAPTPTPEPQPEKGGVPPLAIAGIVISGLAVAGGLVWMFLPRRKHHE